MPRIIKNPWNTDNISLLTLFQTQKATTNETSAI